MNTTADVKAVKVVIEPVDRFGACNRHLGRTWTASVEFSDGSAIRCGHEKHPSIEYAKKCGIKLWHKVS